MGMVASPAVLAPKEANKPPPQGAVHFAVSRSIRRPMSFVSFLLVIERGGRRKRGMFCFSIEHIHKIALQTNGKSVKSLFIG